MQIFKICPYSEWAEAQKENIYRGSAADKHDGFIHLSTSAQLATTLTKHFPNESGLMLIAIESDRLGEALKWEENSAGDAYPHLYGDLPFSAGTWTSTVPLKSPGVYKLPPRAFATAPSPIRN
jgi:uncharacterized protein (DUF952 family)